MTSKKTERRKKQKSGEIPTGPSGVRLQPNLTESWKKKISRSMVLNHLISVAEGKKKNVNPSSVTAGLGLLKKVLPDLSAVHTTDAKEKTHEQWLEELYEKSDLKEHLETGGFKGRDNKEPGKIRKPRLKDKN